MTTMTRVRPSRMGPNRLQNPREDTMGGRIRVWRVRRGMTQTGLGAHAESTKSFISLIEGDRSIPSIYTVSLIAAALGLRLDYLIDGRGRAHR